MKPPTEHRTKNAARKLAQRHVVAQRCARCGTETGKLERHHNNYSAPLSVEVLCPLCHRAEDQKDGFQKKAVHVMRKCAVCGKEYLPARNTRGILCGSSECSSIYGRLSVRKKLEGKSRTKSCVVCGKEFTPKRAREKTCSRPCGNALAWQSRKR